MAKDRIQTQKDEFDKVLELGIQYGRLQYTPIVDDAYPAVRHDYERAVRDVIDAFKENGRIP